jgi:hypothetical protein
MMKDATANGPERQRLAASGGVCDRNSEPPEAFFASDVPLRCLQKSVAKERLNLLQFASTTMAQAGASAAKILGCLCRRNRFTAYQTTLVVTPVPSTIPRFKTRLNTLRSFNPECRSHVSGELVDVRMSHECVYIVLAVRVPCSAQSDRPTRECWMDVI